MSQVRTWTHVHDFGYSYEWPDRMTDVLDLGYPRLALMHSICTLHGSMDLTCIAPASSKSIGKPHNIGAEHDAGPELAGDKACQSPANEESRHDVPSSCVDGCHSKKERGGEHQEKGKGCSTHNTFKQARPCVAK